MCHGSTRQPISLAAVTASSGHCRISPLMSSLMEQVSSSSAAAFLGHSTAVTNKHYWQVTDEDFERAIQGSSKAVQNPAHSLAMTSG
jgi:hypothetical protein